MDSFKTVFVVCVFSIAVTAFKEEHRSSKLTRSPGHVRRGEFPWHVFMSSVKCSGVFIHERWILSSGKCVQLIKDTDSDQRTVFIRVGNHHVELDSPGEDEVPVLRALVHPEYAATSSANFGLLYLARSVILSNKQRLPHVNLPSSRLISRLMSLKNRSASKITGWGHFSGRNSPFTTLGEDDVLLMPGRDCLQSFPDVGKRKLLEESWCVVAGTAGMCSIDQGSPVVIKQNHSWVVVGVYTYGETCSPDKDTALFSRITSGVLEWIQKLFTVGDRPQCQPSGYQILDTPARALSNQVDFDFPLCDNNLEEAWYKLEIHGIPAEIPTKCPSIGSCGTHAQIWMQPEGHPDFGEEKNGSACVAWEGVKRVCCLWQLPVHVTHCGGFLVYHLKKTEECSTAYCAKEAGRVPCGPGKIGYAPRCKVRDLYPTLADSPQITPVVPPDNILASKSIHLLCSYDVTDPGSSKVSYIVTWYKIVRFFGGTPGKLTLLANTTEETAIVVNFESAEFTLGDTIVCEVKTFFSESPDQTSPGFSSEDFYVGIKVEPSSLVISEDHKMKEISFILTVPLVCPPEHPDCTIQIPMHLVPAVYSPRMLSAADIALSTCEVTMKPQSCSRRDCGRKVVRIVAVSDFINDGERRTRIITEPVRSQSPLWKSHDPADAFVLSKHINTPRCHLFTESYIRTLVGRYYRIPSGVSTFLLYKSKTRPFEVHARFWACSKSRNPGYCACGVAARDGDDVIVIDMCSGRFMETSVQISFKSNLPLAKGIRITEAISGKRYTVYFPSGVYVRTDVFEWGLNIQVQSSGRDLHQVTGLCGLGEVNDFFEETNEGLPPEMNGTHQWRFPDGNSLFHYKPLTERRHQTEKLFCQCSLKDNFEKKKKCETCESKCRRHQHVVWPVMSRERDVTKRVQSLQAGRVLERRHNFSDEFYPLDDKSSYQQTLFDSGKPDTLLAVLAVISFCKRLLTDTPLGRACKPVIGERNMDELLRICIRDMRYTGISSIVWGAAAMLQDSCEDLVLKNTSAWEMTSFIKGLTPPKTVTNAMCPRLCNDKGRCVNGTCKCRRGYTSEDCSVPSKTPPQLISIQNDGECDVRKFLCNHVRVVGEGFQNARDLMCSLAEITENPFETQTFLSKATYESFRGVTCEVPRSHDIHEAIRGYEVRVSNDGNLWSQPLPLFIFDGHCLTCTTQGMRCEIKNGTCRIHGRCRRRGETNPQDPCQWCSPKDSQQNWTDIRCHFGTCETSTCVHGVCIDTTMGRYFCFCDEGFTGLNCDVPENSCASNPCGSGTCVQLGSTFRCECPLGYVGVRCLDLINPCSSNPCNNGSCVTNGTHFGCFCDVGFTGLSCETNVQSCLCQHGRCVPQDKNYVCICEVGYTGKFCEVRQDDACSSLLCRNGSCVERDGNTKCLCDSGYTGGLCDIKIDSCINPPCTVGNCSSSPCGHRSCFGDNYNFTCACEFGFTGSNCHTTINMTQESKIGETVSNVTVNFHQNSSFNFTFYHVKMSIDHAEKIASDKRLSAFDGKDLICHGNFAIIEQFLFYQDQMLRIDENMLLCLLHSVNKTCDCGESVAEENCSCSFSFCNCYSHMEQSKNKSWTPSKSNPCKDGYISCKCFNKYSGLPWDRPVTTKALSKGFIVDCSSELECNGTADPCYPNPCVYGKCSYSEEGLQCLCENGYSGKTCNETSRDSCQPSPCIRGKCQNTKNGFRCVCPKGFYGLTCNQVKTRCSINICSHGDCFIEDTGELLCECFRGYEGPLCESLAVDRCQIGICNNGLCINSRTGFRCLCLSGFSGKRCQVRDLCFPNPCANGNCTSKSDGYHCMCHAGFTGRTCRESVDHCQSRPCVRGQCVNTQDTYLCQCPQGFIGDTCNETVNFCSSNPCLHGDCINLKSSFKCECQEGFHGIVCDKRVVFDPCDKNPCSNGRCISVQAMVRIGPLFYCLCDDGFTGQFCQSQIDPCRNNPCKYGLCVAIDFHRFQCKCFKGFQGSTCETEINHCISSPCKNGLCVPRNSTFECSCHPGYKGNLCDEVEDKCQPNPCKHGRCHQESTSIQCLCSVGYTGNLCDSKVDHCGSNPCKHGVCVASSIKSFKCYCKRGYSGELCDQKVNPCTPNPCKQGSCIHRYSSWFACRCELGYTGKMCEKKIDMCQSQPCKNGVCVNFGMYFRCRCAAGFHGRLCDKIETCQSQPCKRGECIATASSFTCRCPEAYTGRYCENKIDPCQSGPCKNSRCIPVKNTFRCLCNKGYTGELCKVTLKPCSSHECKNGKCIAQSSQYSCQCFKGFSGSYCDVDIDECLISPCFAGVDCINSVGSYSCGPCPVGYTGDGLRCEKLMDPCEMLNCLNGTCIAQGGQYFCQCLQGFRGKRCDIDINECLDSPCFVGVDCANYPGSYSCGPCPVGFTGDGSHCEKILHPCEKLNCFKDVPCVYKRQKYECGNCPPGFTGNGTQCTEIDACSSSPCHPLVQCFTLQDSPAGFRCGPCPPGYKGNGINCTSLCPLPCPYGMECIGYYTCRCPEGFQGVGCKTPFCRTGCYNGGTCVKPNVCKCLEGFEGPACLSPVCRPPCRYGGECVGPDKCRCLQGFIGPRCEKKRCLVSCLNDGRCIGPYVCHCMPGYSGQRCEIAPCTPRCQNGGLCIARDVCKCPPEYMGERCQFPLCRPPCINDGHCVRPNVCMCPAAWKGDHCQKPVCHLPCLNGGRCARPNQCTCLSGYEGTMCEKGCLQLSDKDGVSETCLLQHVSFPSAICNQPCLNGGQCVRPGVCACPFGFTGMQCEEKDPWYGNRKQEN